MTTLLPEIKLDSSAEDWEELMVSLARHKEKFNLAVPDLTRQLIACFKFIDSLSHHGLAANIPSDQQESIPEGKVSASTAAQDKVASEIADTREHTQSQDRSRSGKKSRHKSRKKNLSVREDDDDVMTTFMAEKTSYQPQDFKFNSLSFGEIAALMYSARKVTREMQAINKVKIPHMLQ